jgi:hypothetical protein
MAKVKLEDYVQQLRKDGEVVPDKLGGVAKKRVERILDRLGLLGQHAEDRVDAAFALLDERASWFSSATDGLRFCDGASTAQIGCHIGILQRGRTKLDREGRDYWLKPLRDVGALVAVTLMPTGFVDGHPVAKASTSAYRLDESFVELLRCPEAKLDAAIKAWVRADIQRARLERQAEAERVARTLVDRKHSDLIRAACEIYAPQFLKGYSLLAIDDGDGTRISDVQKAKLEEAGVPTHALGSMPDAIFWMPGTSRFAIIEAVTTDGEVDAHKVRSVTSLLSVSHPRPEVHFVTAYRTWREAALRQSRHKNLADESWLWIVEDGARRFRVDFG